MINGRLAMLAFTTGLVAELFSGKTLASQFQLATFPVFGVVSSVWLASLIPLFIGTKQPLEGGFFNFKNELINGRAAMVGFGCMLAFEMYRGTAMFAMPLFGLSM